MENNEIPKPQQTGGLKLMTVFIAVLALHVVVIGGITAYHLMNSSGADADVTLDKAHKSVKANAENDAPLTDGGDKVATVPVPPSTPADNVAPTSPAPAAPTVASSAQVPSGPVQQPETPPAAPAPIENPTLVSSGPVKMPVIEMSPQPAAVGSTNYVVKPHDSLARIAHQHHTTVARLKAANGLNSDLLHIGQKLVLPAKSMAIASATEATPTVLDGNPAPAAPATPKQKTHKYITATTVAPSTATGHKVYTVLKGDTLTKIAHKFKTTPGAIMTANNLSDARKLSIGQKLHIPSMESRSATTAAPAAPSDAAPARETTAKKPTAQLANFMN